MLTVIVRGRESGRGRGNEKGRSRERERRKSRVTGTRISAAIVTDLARNVNEKEMTAKIGTEIGIGTGKIAIEISGMYSCISWPSFTCHTLAHLKSCSERKIVLCLHACICIYTFTPTSSPEIMPCINFKLRPLVTGHRLLT
jgi:hypothetical protein